MKKALAMKWVKALRSGKYKQGKEALLMVDPDNNKHSFCCLGVLGSICKIDKKILKERAVLNGALKEDCGIKDEEGRVPYAEKIKVRVGKGFKEFKSLASANDKGASFKAIATWIEKNYENL